MDKLKLLLTLVFVAASRCRSQEGMSTAPLATSGRAARALLDADDSTCSLIVISDGSPPAAAVLQTLRASPAGAAAVLTVDAVASNLTASFRDLIPLARQVRMASWCSRVVVVSDDHTFLASFARWSIKIRLLVWQVRLLVVTRLQHQQLVSLLPLSWTFSWMNAIFLNVDDAAPATRCDLHTFQPFSPSGGGVVRVASWTPDTGFTFHSHLPLFPEKYSNFHGALVNVTGRLYLPFWGEVEEQAASKSPLKQYYGPDYHLLETVAQSLNFTFRVLPTESWAEVEDLIEARLCLFVGNGYIVLSTRLQRHDFTITFFFDGTSFAMAKPSLGSDLMRVFRPLASHLWGGVATALLLLAAVLLMTDNAVLLGGDV